MRNDKNCNYQLSSSLLSSSIVVVIETYLRAHTLVHVHIHRLTKRMHYILSGWIFYFMTDLLLFLLMPLSLSRVPVSTRDPGVVSVMPNGSVNCTFLKERLHIFDGNHWHKFNNGCNFSAFIEEKIMVQKFWLSDLLIFLVFYPSRCSKSGSVVFSETKTHNEWQLWRRCCNEVCSTHWLSDVWR